MGRVDIPDARLDRLAELVHPQRIVPAFTEFVDIAGLVAGASKGEGLGNKFLAHIRETQAIAHVVRCFEDENIVHVSGRVSPLDDIGIINLELILADLDSLDRQLEKLQKKGRSGDKEVKKIIEIGEKIKTTLETEQPARNAELSEEQNRLARQFQMITMRPVLYVLNMAEDDLIAGNELSATVEKLAAEEGAPCLQICGSIEEEIATLSTVEQLEYLQSIGLQEPGLNRMIRESYQLLDLITYFTAGVEEVRAWTIPNGWTAPGAAGVIHTDMQRGFIRAEVIGYMDFDQCGSEAAARDAGKMRLEGKEYIVQNGDVMHFRFNV